MNDYNKKEQKGGFLGVLSGLFKGGSAAGVGGASSGMGAAGGIFATKAGVVAMMLGGATIAAGVGVVYNFVGPSSKAVYSPELFQNSYYEEEASSASQERAQSRDRSAASASTLDMFSEQARKDGMKGLGDGVAPEEGDADSAASAEAGETPEAPAAPGAGPGAGAAAAGGSNTNQAKLQAAPSFSNSAKGGGSASVAPRLQNQGGMSGGIGGQFASVYRPPAGAEAGKTSRMNAMAARASNSPKYSVPNFNKKGAHGQAKFAGGASRRGAYASSDSGARSSAETAFSGETGTGGDVAAPGAGAGVGGAGVSGGAGLKGNDPSLSSSQYTPLPIGPVVETEPWKDIESKAITHLLIGAAGVVILALLAKLVALCNTPATAWLRWTILAIGTLVFLAALAALGMAFAKALELFRGNPEPAAGEVGWEGQKMMGGLYMGGSIMLMFMAIKEYGNLMSATGSAADTANQTSLDNATTAHTEGLANGTIPEGTSAPTMNSATSGGDRFLAGLNGGAGGGTGVGGAFSSIGGIPGEIFGALKGM